MPNGQAYDRCLAHAGGVVLAASGRCDCRFGWEGATPRQGPRPDFPGYGAIWQPAADGRLRSGHVRTGAHLQRANVELVLAHRNSSQALDLLQMGCVHIAGSHLRDEATGESNLPQVRKLFPRGTAVVFAFAVWEEGIVVAKGNPKAVREIADFARKGVALVNREPGSGSRSLLDSSLKRLGIASSKVKGYEQVAYGHLPAAWQVRTGHADCCVATRAAARVFGLDFVPLVSERYDLVIRKQHLALPAVQLLLDTLNRTAFRRELEGLGGYDTSGAGKQVV